MKRLDTISNPTLSIEDSLSLTPQQIEVLRDSKPYGTVSFNLNANQWEICFKRNVIKNFIKDFIASIHDTECADSAIGDLYETNNRQCIYLEDDLFRYAIFKENNVPQMQFGFAFIVPIK